MPNIFYIKWHNSFIKYLMQLSNNISDRFNLITNNYIPWHELGQNDEYCSKLDEKLKKSNIIKNFYEDSKNIINKFINNINSLSSNYKSIVYISGKCYPMLLRQAKIMKNNGYKTYLINMEPLKEVDYINSSNCFDDIIQNCLFFPLLGNILDSIKTNYFHVQCWMLSYYLGKFVIQKKKKAKVVCELYDVTGMYSNEKNLKKVYESFIIDQDLENERFIFENADGIIHRYKQQIFLDYSKKYKRKK